MPIGRAWDLLGFGRTRRRAFCGLSDAVHSGAEITDEPVPGSFASSKVNSMRGSSRSAQIIEHADDPRNLGALKIIGRVVVGAVVSELLHSSSQP